MKITDSQRIAGISTISFVVLAALFYLINYLFRSQLLISLLVTIPIFIVIIFGIIYSIIKEFIDRKIKPIYKTIHGFKPKNFYQTEDVKGVFDKVNSEVIDWMEGRANEIQNLRQIEKYRKEYIGNVSHELKTPIFNIQGYILTLIDGGIDDPNINNLYLKRTEKSIDRMISIIEDLEAISKLESGELEIYPEIFSIHQLVLDVFESNEMRANEKSIKFRIGKNDNLDIKVKADKQRIYQVLMNLIVNSINYGKLHGRTSVRFYDMDNLVLVEIKDNGLGINAEDLPRIFERFYRADKSRSRVQGGTGLGLSIVKHIIEAHKQTINVTSKIGEGTSFTFTLEKA